MTKVYTLDECKKHTSEEDCWLVIYDKVYDVTKFLEDHPGGSEIMVSSTGRDATDDFEDVVHSTTARKQLDSFYIGDLHEDDKNKAKSAATSQAYTHTGTKSVSPVTTFIKAILPFIFVVVAYYIYQNKVK